MDDTKELKVNITLNVVCDCEKGLVKRVEETIVKPTTGSDSEMWRRTGFGSSDIEKRNSIQRGYEELNASLEKQMEWRERYDMAEKEYGMLWPVYKYFWKFK